MTSIPPSWPQTLSCKVYGWLLLLYPKSYRQRFAVDMARTFSDCCRFASQTGGVSRLLRLWLPTLFDLSLTIVNRHLEEGLLSSGLTVLRLTSFALLAAATTVYAFSWGSGIGVTAFATLLFLTGAVGLFCTSGEGRKYLKQRLNRSDNAGQLPPEKSEQHDLETVHALEKVGRGFLLRWMVVSGMGLVVGFALVFRVALANAPQLDIGMKTFLSVMGGGILGATIGISQWLILRGHVSQPRRWIFASVAGGAVGGSVAVVFGEMVSDAAGYYWGFVFGASSIGVSLGVAGWWVLRRDVSHAFWWILASTAGILVAAGLSNVLGRVLHTLMSGVVGDSTARTIGTLLIVSLFLTGYGGITGPVLARLLRQTVPRSLTRT